MTCTHPSPHRRRLPSGLAHCSACGATGPSVACTVSPLPGYDPDEVRVATPLVVAVPDPGQSTITIDVTGLSLDEGAIVLEAATEVRDALLGGVATYGHLRIDEDPRDWEREAEEERRDLQVYRLAAKLRERRRA